MRTNTEMIHKGPSTVCVALAAALLGCSSPAPPEQATQDDELDVANTSSPVALDFGEDDEEDVPAIGLGATHFPEPALKCGGVAHMACPRGYGCRMAEDGSSDPMGTCVRDLGRDHRKLARLGERCGGVAGFECQGGLTCKLDDVDQSDPMGTCVTPHPPTK